MRNSSCPLSTGVRLLPVAVCVALASVLGTRMAVRIGHKAVVAAGLLLFAAELPWTSTAAQGTSYGIIVAEMILLGLGMGLTSAPAIEAIMGAVPPAKAGVGSAAFLRSLAGGCLVAAGVAVAGALIAALLPARPRRQDEITSGQAAAMAAAGKEQERADVR